MSDCTGGRPERWGLLPWNRGRSRLLWTPTDPRWRAEHEPYGAVAQRRAIKDAAVLYHAGVRP